MAALSSLASTRRFSAPLVRSNARRVFANGIDRQSAGFAPAQQRRCVVVAANRKPATLPKEPTKEPKKKIYDEKWEDPDYNKWEDPEFLRMQATVAAFPLLITASFVVVGWWPAAVVYAIVIAPLVIQEY